MHYFANVILRMFYITLVYMIVPRSDISAFVQWFWLLGGVPARGSDLKAVPPRGKLVHAHSVSIRPWHSPSEGLGTRLQRTNLAVGRFVTLVGHLFRAVFRRAWK